MSRALREALISMAALAVLLMALMAIDPRVREHVQGVVQKDTLSADVARVNAQAHDAVTMAKWAARERGLNHAALAVFVVVATGLVVAMLRL